MNDSSKKGASKYLIWLGVIVLIAAVVFGIVMYAQSNESSDESPVDQGSTADYSIATEQQVLDSIEASESADRATEGQDIITYTAKSGTSALSQLQEINDTVVVQESELGSYVESINGLVGGTDGKYWSFYVNDELASVGAGAFMPEGGEEIKWHFVKL